MAVHFTSTASNDTLHSRSFDAVADRSVKLTHVNLQEACTCMIFLNSHERLSLIDIVRIKV